MTDYWDILDEELNIDKDVDVDAYTYHWRNLFQRLFGHKVPNVKLIQHEDIEYLTWLVIQFGSSDKYYRLETTHHWEDGYSYDHEIEEVLPYQTTITKWTKIKPGVIYRRQ